MDLLDIGCELLTAPGVGAVMEIAGYFGHGPLLPVIVLSLLVAGFLKQDARLKRGGAAVLLSLIVSGLLAETLKHVANLPRPTGTGLGLPSGHATAAFTLAGSLSMLFPAYEPLFYLGAVTTGISRMYFRAHFVADVVSGAVLGSIVGTFLTRWIARARAPRRKSAAYALGWMFAGLVSVAALSFFWQFETSTEAHRVASSDLAGQVGFRLDLDRPSVDRFLGEGWTFYEGEDESPRVWAPGSVSRINLPDPAPASSRWLRLRIKPHVGKGPSCETVRAHANDADVATIHLEKGWHDYMIAIPRAAAAKGHTSIEFWYDEAVDRSPNTDGGKPAGIGFDEMILVESDGPSERVGTRSHGPPHEPTPYSLATRTRD